MIVIFLLNFMSSFIKDIIDETMKELPKEKWIFRT